MLFMEYYTFIACWWGKYENLFIQEYHISRGQRPRGIWYSWVIYIFIFPEPACYRCFIIANETKKTQEHVITQDKNHIPWNKYHIPPLRKPREFSRQSYRSLTGKRQSLGTRATVTMLLWMWFSNVWDNVPMDLKYVCQQYFTCMCFLGFIRYNKLLSGCELTDTENISLPSPNMKFVSEWAKQTSHKLHILSSRLIFR
jgi:hypothetical protein